MAQSYFERILLLAGDQDTGKSSQLRSMFLDPRLSDRRIGEKGTIPQAPNIPKTFSLSSGRSLLVRLTSPHEAGESLKSFVDNIRAKTSAGGRWCLAAAVQVTPTARMPGVPETVRTLIHEFAPERVRVGVLSPDRHGTHAPGVDTLTAQLQSIERCDVMKVDAREKSANGFLLADTFDFT